MVDDVLLNKAAAIERCLRRIREEYDGHEAALESNFTRQDAIILNLLRACEAAIDMAMHAVRRRGLGLPQDSRDAFAMLGQAGLLPGSVVARMQAMVGFRNIAVHDYQSLSLPVLRAILASHLDDFQHFTAALLGSMNASERN